MSDTFLNAVSRRMPKTNRAMLCDYPEKSILSAADHINNVFKSMLKLIGPSLEYRGYEPLSPEDRISEELGLKKRRSSKSPGRKIRLQMTRSTLTAVRFKFAYVNNEEKLIEDSMVINVPFLDDGVMIIRGKVYAITMGIVNKRFARDSDKESDGIVARVIRAPLGFRRLPKLYKLTPYGYDGSIDSQHVVIAHLHHSRPSRSARKRLDTGLIHYLICKFGFYGMLNRFGLTKSQMSLVQYPVTDDPNYFYFPCLDQGNKAQDLWLKVDKVACDQTFTRKLAANILYTLTNFDQYAAGGKSRFRDHYNGKALLQELEHPNGGVWRVMLGIILKQNESLSQARAHADVHIVSADSFLDDMTRDRFGQFGVQVEDIYSLLVYVFLNIDSIVVNSSSNNLYEKRLDIKQGIFTPAFVQPLFSRVYDLMGKTTLRDDEVKTLLRPNPMMIENAFSASSRGGGRNISTSPSIYNDNRLVSCSIFKFREDGTPGQSFHPSMNVVESITSFSGALGSAGLLNPFLEIDENGGILHPHYAKEIDELSNYLPS